MRKEPFNAAESQRHAEQGMLFAAENNAALLTEAREIARDIARRKGEVTADDVQLELHRRGVSIKALGNAAWLVGSWHGIRQTCFAKQKRRRSI